MAISFAFSLFCSSTERVCCFMAAFSFTISSSVIPNTSANAHKAFMSGTEEPFSHFDTVLSDYEILSPSSDCVSEALVRSSLMFTAMLCSMLSFIYSFYRKTLYRVKQNVAFSDSESRSIR